MNLISLEIYNQMYENLRSMFTSNVNKQTVMNIFQNYHEQVLKMFSKNKLLEEKNILNSQKQRLSTQNSQNSLAHQQNDNPSQVQQPSYIFLRKIWQGKYCTRQLTNYDSQDHIDKINKVVAMMRTRINYMTKKQNYMYEKDDTNNRYLCENPIFNRIKQEFERLRMSHEELIQENHKQKLQIKQLQNQKCHIQNLYQNLKKKHQQVEKNWIQISKKNICLEQECMNLKSLQNSKSKLSQLRESLSSNQINLYSNLEAKSSLSFKKIADEKNKQISQKQLIDELQVKSASKLQKSTLQNIFVDISLNSKNKQTSKKIKENNRYAQNHQRSADNQQTQFLKDVTQRICLTNNDLNINTQIEKATLEKINSQRSPFNLKYIRNEGSGRKALFSSIRSVDLAEKTSIAKPKFERTKQNYQNLLKSVGKQGFVVSSQENLQNQSSKIKKKTIISGDSNLLSNYKSPLREVKRD